VLDDFEVDEGHFNWVYSTSPVSQTNGLAAGTTIERVTTEAQGGDGAQELHLVPESAGGLWSLRHNSGIGLVANPAGNEPLEATGRVGFWLKTNDAGLKVQIGVDDPVGNTALERGVLLDVIADDQWHLYQWDFENDDEWQPYAGGANGNIDAVGGTVTIDSIWLSGSGEATLYLDTVSHNPEGPLTAAGDFNGDGMVDSEDLTAWGAGVGTPSGATALDGDGDGDGDVDGGDFLVWQRHLGMTNITAAAGAAASTVPEPRTLWLMTAGYCAALLSRARRHAW
jgi:hypothetical protein